MPLRNGESVDLNISLIKIKTLPSYVGPLKVEVSFLDFTNNAVLDK